MEQENVGVLERIDRWFDKDVDRKLNALATLFFGYLFVVMLDWWVFGIDVIEVIANVGVAGYLMHVGRWALAGVLWVFLSNVIFEDSYFLSSITYITLVVLSGILVPDLFFLSLCRDLGFVWANVHMVFYFSWGYWTACPLLSRR